EGEDCGARDAGLDDRILDVAEGPPFIRPEVHRREHRLPLDDRHAGEDDEEGEWQRPEDVPDEFGPQAPLEPEEFGQQEAEAESLDDSRKEDREDHDRDDEGLEPSLPIPEGRLKARTVVTAVVRKARRIDLKSASIRPLELIILSYQRRLNPVFTRTMPDGSKETATSSSGGIKMYRTKKPTNSFQMRFPCVAKNTSSWP